MNQQGTPEPGVWLSVILPTLNEEASIVETLAPLQPYRNHNAGLEVILSDGGSQDGTLACAKDGVDHIVRSLPGRARQMNAGAARAQGRILLFLHADTRLPPDFFEQLHLFHTSNRLWGRFDVQLSHPAAVYRLISRLINLRSRATSIATGDQGIFVQKVIFQEVGGFADIVLMEDVELCRRMRAMQPAYCISSRVITSSRKWEREGVLRTIWLMWRLRWLFFCGADPETLCRRYYGDAYVKKIVSSDS
ncbi:MAG: TIGR04283 family arsenosugar biosynthesis glycosyltransferase [Pseudomonadales bacterium]|nr:TIGR04283 family arsenosugar biosynthesis glycosyltransferase [Pseudomonadales bacterium]